MGCLARLGCLILIVILACAAWLTRGAWMPEQFRPRAERTASGWEPATSAGAVRVRAALDRLGSPRGPAYVTVSAGDLASYLSTAVAKRLGSTADSVAGRVVDDRVTVRARVDLERLRGTLGALAGVVGDREMVELTGRVRVVKPGLAEFEVVNATVGRITLPQPLISRLIRSIDHGARPAAVGDRAFPLPIPASIGDIRVAGGTITLYKNVK